MNIDLSKYLKNDEIKISNEDFDMKALSKEVYKGYTKNEDIPSTENMIDKSQFDKLQNDYAELEKNYNATVKTLGDTNDKVAKVSLENKLIRRGFKEEDFDDIVKLRNSLYADEKDDQKAVDSIAEKFKDTYFKNETEKFDKSPDESGLTTEKKESTNKVIVTRQTSIKDLMMPVTK